MMTISNVLPVRAAWCVALCSMGAALQPAEAAAQIPDTFTNLQHLPEDISRDSLIGIMRGFSFALDVRCQYCHAGGDGRSFEGVEFDSDDKAAKRRARYMLGMMDEINTNLLTDVPDRRSPNVNLECQTCHRGLARPRMIDDLLRERIATEGAEAAVAYYQTLRERSYGGWSYDFGEWAINDLATEMAESGNTAAAIALMEMNAEYYQDSFPVWQMLGDYQRTAGDREGAIASYRQALRIVPENPGILRRLRDMGASPGR